MIYFFKKITLIKLIANLVHFLIGIDSVHLGFYIVTLNR